MSQREIMESPPVAFASPVAFAKLAALESALGSAIRGKAEAVRLCTWSELTNFSFKEPYDPLGATNSTAGVAYYGTVTRSAAASVPNTASYLNNMCLVTVNLTWTNSRGSAVYNRKMETHYARYGLQSYIWGAF